MVSVPILCILCVFWCFGGSRAVYFFENGFDRDGIKAGSANAGVHCGAGAWATMGVTLNYAHVCAYWPPHLRIGRSKVDHGWNSGQCSKMRYAGIVPDICAAPGKNRPKPAQRQGIGHQRIQLTGERMYVLYQPGIGRSQYKNNSATLREQSFRKLFEPLKRPAFPFAPAATVDSHGRFG